MIPALPPDDAPDFPSGLRGKVARERWPAHVTSAVSELGTRQTVVLDDGVGRVPCAGAMEAERTKSAAALAANGPPRLDLRQRVAGA